MGGRIKKTVYRRDKALYNVNTGVPLFGSSTPLPATAANLTLETTRYIGQLYEERTVGSAAKQSTKFIYLGSSKIAAVTGSDVMFYHTDHLGGTNVLTDQVGLPRELTEYDPFGQIIKHEKYGSDFVTAWYYFTGKSLDDETGLVYFGARYYNPKLGRFITPDTLVPSFLNPQTLNRYTYCYNNPVNLIDPDGHKPTNYKEFAKATGNIALFCYGGAAVALFLKKPGPAQQLLEKGAIFSNLSTAASAIDAYENKDYAVMGGYLSLAYFGGFVQGSSQVLWYKWLNVYEGSAKSNLWSTISAEAILYYPTDLLQSVSQENSTLPSLSGPVLNSTSVVSSSSSPVSDPSIVFTSLTSRPSQSAPSPYDFRNGPTLIQRAPVDQKMYGPGINRGQLNYHSTGASVSFGGDGSSDGSYSGSTWPSLTGGGGLGGGSSLGGGGNGVFVAGGGNGGNFPGGNSSGSVRGGGGQANVGWFSQPINWPPGQGGGLYRPSRNDGMHICANGTPAGC